MNGVTPSSTTGLVQLESVAPELKDRICEWEGSSGLSADLVQALVPTISKGYSIAEAALAAYGELPHYAAKKAAWMADTGLNREALHLVWNSVGWLARFAIAGDDPQMTSEAIELVQDWFRAVGWEGQEVLEEKVRMAEEMVAEVEAMAAHLPLDEE